MSWWREISKVPAGWNLWVKSEYMNKMKHEHWASLHPKSKAVSSKQDFSETESEMSNSAAHRDSETSFTIDTAKHSHFFLQKRNERLSRKQSADDIETVFSHKTHLSSQVNVSTEEFVHTSVAETRFINCFTHKNMREKNPGAGFILMLTCKHHIRRFCESQLYKDVNSSPSFRFLKVTSVRRPRSLYRHSFYSGFVSYSRLLGGRSCFFLCHTVEWVTTAVNNPSVGSFYYYYYYYFRRGEAPLQRPAVLGSALRSAVFCSHYLFSLCPCSPSALVSDGNQPLLNEHSQLEAGDTHGTVCLAIVTNQAPAWLSS